MVVGMLTVWSARRLFVFRKLALRGISSLLDSVEADKLYAISAATQTTPTVDDDAGRTPAEFHIPKPVDRMNSRRISG